MKKRIFISFAVEDARLRDLLVGQARSDASPFDFVDMSVKEPWDFAWKTNCKTKIKGCDGLIAIITNNSNQSEGEMWEVKCAKNENIPCIGVWGHTDYKILPVDFMPLHVMDWSWSNIARWLRML